MSVAGTTEQLRSSPRVRFIAALGAVLATLALSWIAAAAPEDTPRHPVAASDGEHMWFFERAGSVDSSRVNILHHGPGHRELDAEQASVIEDMPEAVLAVDGRLYCIFRGKRNPDGGFQKRPVSTVRAEVFDPSSRSWKFEPWPRARTVASLPGGGRVAGFVADGREPLVLLVENPEWARIADGDASPEPSLPRLLRLAVTEWKEIELPEAVRQEQHLVLIGGARPTILARDETSQGVQSIAYTLNPDQSWSASAVAIDPDGFVASTQHEGQTYIATRTGAAGRIAVSLVRPPHVYPVLELDYAASDPGLIAFAHHLALAQAPPENDRLILTRLDVQTGEVEQPVVYRRRLRPALEDFSLLVLVGALLFSFVVMLVFRPADPSRMNVALPGGARIAEPRRRVVALLIDLLPSALLSGLILGVPLARVLDLSHLPMRAHQVDEGVPMLLMFLICVVHSTLSELLWGRTLGKALLDCWVIGIDGKRASVSAVIVRNAMKFVALCVPVLFLFVYINQYRQRLGDLAARTVVVTHGEEAGSTDRPADGEG